MHKSMKEAIRGRIVFLRKVCIYLPYIASRTIKAIKLYIPFHKSLKTDEQLVGTYFLLQRIKSISIEKFKRYKTENDKRNLNHIRKKENVRIGFVVHTSSMWTIDELYNLLKDNDRFTVDIIVVRTFMNAAAADHEYRETIKYFTNKGYPIVEARGIKDPKCYDIIFYTHPYEFRDRIYIEDLPLSTMALYTSYGFMLSGFPARRWLYHLVYRYYADSVFYVSHVAKDPRYSDNAVCLGYSKMDGYYKAEASRTTDKKVIIYAPHHSVAYKNSRFATFADNYLQIYEFAKKHSQDVFWIYKPHPLLQNSAVAAGIFDNADAYFEYENMWRNLPNGEVATGGDYFPLFKESDAMITDSVSFLAEYQFTHKPLLLLESGEGRYNEFGESLREILYRCPGTDYDSIERFIGNVVNGKDEMSERRMHFFNEYLDYYGDDHKSANRRIYEDILNIVEGNVSS